MNREIKLELEEQKSILSILDKQYFTDNKTIPVNYFDTMEDDFFSKIKAEKEDNRPGETKSISMWTASVSYRIAAVLVFAIVGVMFFNLFQRDETKHLSQVEVINYLKEEDELTDEPIEKIASVIDLSKLSKKEVAQYLIDNEDIDINSI